MRRVSGQTNLNTVSENNYSNNLSENEYSLYSSSNSSNSHNSTLNSSSHSSASNSNSQNSNINDRKGYYNTGINTEEIYYYNGIDLFQVAIIEVNKKKYSIRLDEPFIRLKNKTKNQAISNLSNYNYDDDLNDREIPFYNYGSIVSNKNNKNKLYEIIDIFNYKKKKFSISDKVAYLKLKDVNKSTYLTTVIVPGYKMFSDYIIVESSLKKNNNKKFNPGNKVFIIPNTSKIYNVERVHNNIDTIYLEDNNGIYEKHDLEKFNKLKHASKSTIVINDPNKHRIGKNTTVIGLASQYLYKFNPGDKVKITGNTDKKEYILKTISQLTGKVELIDNSVPESPVILRRSLKTNNIEHVNTFSELLSVGDSVYTVDKITGISKNNPARIKKISGLIGKSTYKIEKKEGDKFINVSGNFKADGLVKVKKTNNLNSKSVSRSITEEPKTINLSVGKRVIIKKTIKEPERGPFTIKNIELKSSYIPYSTDKYLLSNGKKYKKNNLEIYKPAPQVTSATSTAVRKTAKNNTRRGIRRVDTPESATLSLSRRRTRI